MDGPVRGSTYWGTAPEGSTCPARKRPSSAMTIVVAIVAGGPAPLDQCGGEQGRRPDLERRALLPERCAVATADEVVERPAQAPVGHRARPRVTPRPSAW